MRGIGVGGMNLKPGAFWGRLVPVILMVLVAAVMWWNPSRPPAGPSTRLTCPDLQRGCETRVAGVPVRVRVSGELKPLVPFHVRVETTGTEKMTARFTMEGMDMGFNLYTLRPDGTGAFMARVTLPVCVTGRRDWIMHLEWESVRLEVPFFTDL